MDSSIAAAYRYCFSVVRGHYENFPVASHLLPRRIRPAIAAIYTFARRGDDWADEGDYSIEQRLQQLEEMEVALTSSPAQDLLFTALHDTIERFQLPLTPFRDLLAAFRQDLTVRRYRNQRELESYCALSANPVGQLLLSLRGAANSENIRCSDALCTALQRINFLQDIEQDYHEMGRIYLPQEEMARYGVGEAAIAQGGVNEGLQRLLQAQIRQIEARLAIAEALPPRLERRFGLECALIIAAAKRICRKLQRRQRCFERCRLSRRDYLPITVEAVKIWQPFVSK
ncbi:MAG: squalene synthase HpnC [Gammaproteobacteria bacterium]|nr:squalene synthase HpnC [Gammaproteobacteria bacterium]